MSEWLKATVDTLMGIEIQIETAPGTDKVHLSAVVDPDLVEGGTLILDEARVIALTDLAELVEEESRLLLGCSRVLNIMPPGKTVTAPMINEALGGTEQIVPERIRRRRFANQMTPILWRLQKDGLVERVGDHGWVRPERKDEID